MWTFRAGVRYRLWEASYRVFWPFLVFVALYISFFPKPKNWNLAPAFALAAGERYEVREIKPHIFVWIPEDIIDQEGDPQFSRAGNAGFIVTPQAVVAVNTTNSPFHARELLYEIRRRADAQVKYVIHTDSRGDQPLCNEMFLHQQAPILSTPPPPHTIPE